MGGDPSLGQNQMDENRAASDSIGAISMPYDKTENVSVGDIEFTALTTTCRMNEPRLLKQRHKSSIKESFVDARATLAIDFQFPRQNIMPLRRQKTIPISKSSANYLLVDVCRTSYTITRNSVWLSPSAYGIRCDMLEPTTFISIQIKIKCQINS